MNNDSAHLATGPKRAVIYARVSGDDRGREGRNLAGQLEMGREHCQRKGYDIVGELSEDERGASGAEINLPQLNTARDLARAGQYEILVVREIDRLSRNLAKQLIVEEELKRAGVTIDYVLGDYPDTPEGNFMKNVRASVAEFEREKIRERMVRGRKRKAEAGKWVGHCLAYGYRKVGHGREAVLEIDEVEAEVVVRIFNLYIVDKLNLRQIAIRLSEEGVIPPGRDYNKPARFWNPWAVLRIFRNTSYIGKFPYAGCIVSLPDMALVNESLFNAVQAILSTHRKTGNRRTPGRYLLIDHVFCSCQRRMTGTTQRSGKYVYYECFNKSYIPQLRDCQARAVRVDVVEAMVWAWLVKLMEDEERLRQGLEGMRAERDDEVQIAREQLKDIDRLIERADLKIAGLMRTFGGDDDVIETLRAEVNTQKRLKTDLTDKRTRLLAQISKRAITPEQIESVLDFARRVRSRMENATWQGKDSLIDLLNVRVDVIEGEPRKINMQCDLPGSALQGDYSSNR